MIKVITQILNFTTVEGLEAIGAWDPNTVSYDEEYRKVTEALHDPKKTLELSNQFKDFLKNNKGKVFKLVTRDFLRSLVKNLATYSKYASHKKIESVLPDYNENIFIATDYGRECLTRVLGYPKTNIRYTTYLRYGLERIRKDLLDCGIKANVQLCLASHEPCDYDEIIETGHEGMYQLFIPIMPTVLIQKED
ncbi:MAG: hypothetical protein KBT06_04345 [Prevotellaceae bacterium]|nr:hypothetical protein [Candidatus Colivivens equi]